MDIGNRKIPQTRQERASLSGCPGSVHWAGTCQEADYDQTNDWSTIKDENRIGNQISPCSHAVHYVHLHEGEVGGEAANGVLVAHPRLSERQHPVQVQNMTNPW